jgi:hypothetical protein
VPILASTAAAQVADGVLAVATIAAVDGGVPLTYTIAGGVDASAFRIDPVTGLLSFAAPPMFAHPADADANNVYDVIVQASDGTESATQTLSAVVTSAASSPQVYVNSAWAGLLTGTPISNVNPNSSTTQSATIGINAFPTIQGGVDASNQPIYLVPGTYSQPVTFSQSLTLNVPELAATIAGDVVGTAGLVKTGNGTLALTGVDSDAGNQIVAGSLLIDGTMTTSTASTLPSNETLGGTGTFAGAVTTSGIVASGDASNAIGVLTTGSLTLGAPSIGAATLAIDLASATSYDRVIVPSIDIASATLSINAASGLATGDQFTIVSVAGSSGGVTGQFDGLTEGGTVTAGNQMFRISYAGGDGNDIVLTDVTPVSLAAGPVLNRGLSYVGSTLASQQHSMIENVVYSFSTPVSLSTSNFVLTGINGTTSAPNVALSSSGGGTVWTVTFSGTGVNNATHSIGDGEYSLVLSGVDSLAPNTYDFFRLLGDMDGNGTVDSADFSIFISSFLRATNDPAYLGADDFDGNNTVDSADFSIFVSNFLHSLPGTTSLH